uniref:Metalloendopeptidase n=1 Tax=Strongyloides venezuelensis TaxID=75913 RepID=A0A0K0FI59_STRVS
MKLSLLLALISTLWFLQNLVESKKSSKKKILTLSRRSPYPIKPSFVSYFTKSDLGSKLIKSIDSILSDLSSFICLQFKKQKNLVKNKIGINFYSKKEYSKVELSSSGKKPTKVYLEKSINKNDLLFYIGYALGLVPETTRNDSRLYVDVFEKNISPPNFEKYYKVKNYDSEVIASTSFDFYSKMLPSQKFKSVKGRLTYKFKGSLFQYYEKYVYNTEFFSFSDVKRLWYLYCSEKCEPLDCRNGGYSINSCQKCRCPPPFTGEKCEKLNPNQRSCGNKQEFIATSYKSFYTIKNISTFCFYSIKSKNGKKVQFNIKYLNISHADDCSSGVVLSVKYRKDKSAGSLSLCGKYRNISFPPLSSEIYLSFIGNGNDNLHFSIKEEY